MISRFGEGNKTERGIKGNQAIERADDKSV
jgi:hypothetical protein